MGNRERRRAPHLPHRKHEALPQQDATAAQQLAHAATTTPPNLCNHRLSNRSALHWLIDRYRVRTDKRSGIVNDPNRLDDPQYIIRLMGKVIAVSVETVKIVEALPEL